jgi:hypothetical protein
MSHKRNRNKKSWKRARAARPRTSVTQQSVGTSGTPPVRIGVAGPPSELDQVGAMIVAEELSCPLRT